MSGNAELMLELDAMQQDILFHSNIIENAFELLDGRKKAWDAKRQEVLKYESKKLLTILRERDTVSKKREITKFGYVPEQDNWSPPGPPSPPWNLLDRIECI